MFYLWWLLYCKYMEFFLIQQRNGYICIYLIRSFIKSNWIYIPEIWYHLIGLVTAFIYVMHVSRFIIVTYSKKCEEKLHHMHW